MTSKIDCRPDSLRNPALSTRSSDSKNNAISTQNTINIETAI
jgi:hypothetical protein